MAGSSTPGPLGSDDNRPLPDAGTQPRIATPGPGSTRGPGLAAAAAADAQATVENDAAIEALDLAGAARTAAYALKRAHPAVRFTSGRRGKADQARAMASNVVTNRQWIEQTYRASPLRTRCQEWVDSHGDQTTQAQIAAGLLSVFDTATDDELGRFSKHLSGEAFDVQPVEQDADAIKATLRSLPGLDKFLDMEGGLVRWHAQF
jgi:hypothetical protein